MKGHVDASMSASQFGFRWAELHGGRRLAAGAVRGRCTKVQAEDAVAVRVTLHQWRVDASDQCAGAHGGMVDDRGSPRSRAGLVDTGIESSLDGTDTEQIALILLTLVELNLIFFGTGFHLLFCGHLLQPLAIIEKFDESSNEGQNKQAQEDHNVLVRQLQISKPI